MELIDLAKSICLIAQDAGEAIMEIYNKEDDFKIESKSDESPLTIADKTANAIICSGLEKLDTIYPIISEENKQVAYEERAQWTRCWMVDPLDGTKEFIKRNGDFTVNIALIENHEVILGVVYLPVEDRCYYAVKGEGAFEIQQNDTDIQLHAKAFDKEDEGLKIVCSRSHLSQETQDYMAKFNKPETVSRGSSLKFIIIAENKAHLYPRIAPTMEWDTAAAHIILREAGGSVVEFESGQPLRYNKENLLNPYFIAEGNSVN